RLANVVERQYRAARTNAHALDDPIVAGADVEALEERVGDLVLGMEVSQSVNVERHRERPETCSPPSTRITSPLIHAASAVDNRKIASATSCGVVSRRKGFRRRACDFKCSAPGIRRSAGVSVTPAWMTLQRIPRCAISTAIERATDSSATLAAATAA